MTYKCEGCGHTADMAGNCPSCNVPLKEVAMEAPATPEAPTTPETPETPATPTTPETPAAQ